MFPKISRMGFLCIKAELFKMISIFNYMLILCFMHTN